MSMINLNEIETKIIKSPCKIICFDLRTAKENNPYFTSRYNCFYCDRRYRVHIDAKDLTFEFQCLCGAICLTEQYKSGSGKHTWRKGT